ncbi:MAG TPA: ABC transporter permease [Anaerolineales bacterium]
MILTPAGRLTGIRAWWGALGAMVRKEFTVMTRYPVEFVATFGQIFAIVAIFTLAGLNFSSPSSEVSSSTAGVVIYGFLLFLFLSDTLWSIGYNLRNEQKQGTLEQLYLSPASKFSALMSRVCTTLFWTGLLSIAGTWLMATLLGELPFANPGLGGYLLAMSLSGTFGIGFAFAGVTLWIKEAGQTAASILQFGFLVLCAVFFPFSALPAGLLAVSRAIPLAYAVDGFRSTLMGLPPGFPELAPIGTEIVITTLFGLFMPLLGYLVYRRAEAGARRSGSLSEY